MAVGWERALVSGGQRREEKQFLVRNDFELMQLNSQKDKFENKIHQVGLMYILHMMSSTDFISLFDGTPPFRYSDVVVTTMKYIPGQWYDYQGVFHDLYAEWLQDTIALLIGWWRTSA